MATNQYSWLSFLKKVIDAIKYIILFFIGRNKERDKQEYIEFKKDNEKINDSYSKIDQEKEDKKKDDLDKRLNNLF